MLTTTFISTQANGVPATITQTLTNPSLNADDNNGAPQYVCTLVVDKDSHRYLAPGSSQTVVPSPVYFSWWALLSPPSSCGYCSGYVDGVDGIRYNEMLMPQSATALENLYAHLYTTTTTKHRGARSAQIYVDVLDLHLSFTGIERRSMSTATLLLIHPVRTPSRRIRTLAKAGVTTPR